jgi:hypothetical protein
MSWLNCPGVAKNANARYLRSFPPKSVDLVKCNEMRDVFELTLIASASTHSIEPSSPSHERKHNSFLGRWFGTDPNKATEDEVLEAANSEVMIERDRLIMCQIKKIAKVSM